MGFNFLKALIFASVCLMLGDGEAAFCNGGSSRRHPCPHPWLAFRGHCYLWVDKPMQWMDAERYCEMKSLPGKLVAHLTSIHSNEEEDFIKQYVMKASGRQNIAGYWMGFNDRNQENMFTWTDGSDALYTNWRQGEPNDGNKAGINEDCVESFKHHADDKWNDLSCTEEVRFVCKM